MHRFRQFLSDVFIIDNNTVILHSVDIIAITAENNHIHGLASVLAINFSTDKPTIAYTLANIHSGP